jgi:hypothetical protein
MSHSLAPITDSVQAAATALRVVCPAMKLKDAPLMPGDAEAFNMTLSPILRALRTAVEAMCGHQTYAGDLALHEAIGQIQMVDDVLTGIQLGHTDGACLPDLAAATGQASGSPKAFLGTALGNKAPASTLLAPQVTGVVH